MSLLSKSTSQPTSNWSRLELAKSHLEKINTYDYIKMINFFKYQDSIDKLKKKKIKKVKTINAEYKRNVSQMLTRKRETENKRINDIQKELTERNRLIERNKMQIQREREEELIKAKTERETMNKSARCNFDNHYALLEEKRLLEERRTMERMQAFKDKYSEVSAERKTSYVKKRFSSYEKHQRQHQLCLERERSVIVGKEEKKFNKFYCCFWNKKERMKKAKEIQRKKNEKYIKVAELKQENENNDTLRKKKIMKKISSIPVKCNILETKRLKKREMSVMEDQRKQMLVHSHINRHQEEEKSIRHGVLEYQREIVSRSVDRENALLLKRINALENIVVNQLEFEKKIPQFAKEIKMLQEESIMKKDWDKRKEVYKELLRLEYEKRKKQKEEQLAKQ